MGIWSMDGRSAIGRGKGDRRSLGSLTNVNMPPMSPGPAVDHGPLTLTEKCVSFLWFHYYAHTTYSRHADLLQFIAQKESKCLELRSQLAVHESELADLKRKWERIVSRGMDRAYSSPLTSSRPTTMNGVPVMTPASAVSSIIPTANAAIKEGVRLLAAGLEISASEPSSPPAFSPPAVPVSGIATVSRATMASTAALKKAASRHAATQSMSSVSTATTSTSTSTNQRLSQSSASSLMSTLSLEDPVEEEPTATIPMSSEGKPEALAEAVQIISPRSANASLRRRSKDSDSRPLQRSSVQVDIGVASTTSLSLSPTSAKSPLSPNTAGWMGSVGTSVGKKWEEIQRGDTYVMSPSSIH